MISRIMVRGSPVFDEIIVYPSIGFNVISGVSGSGKSIFINSILSLFGIKDCVASYVECELENALNGYSNATTIAMSKNEKTKYFVNGSPSSKKKIKDIFGKYVHYINSHSVDELSNILSLLDSIICAKDENFSKKLDSYSKLYRELMNAKSNLEKLENNKHNINELIDFATYEISQIESINPKIGEYEELLELKKDLSKKDKILEKISLAKSTIDGFDNLISLLDLISGSQEYIHVLRDIESAIIDEEDRLLSIDTENVEIILDRIEKLSILIHKYGSIESALEYRDKKKQELEGYNNINFDMDLLTKRIEQLTNDVEILGKEISCTRNKYIQEFTNRVSHYCDLLSLNTPVITLSNIELSEYGFDKLTLFLGDSNIKSLSSGEFNRLKLAFLCINVEVNSTNGIIILDEIDANLSGSESDGIAKVLSVLSASYQIFAISHQAHMPSCANNHYLVYKEDNKSNIVLLDKEGRVREIARMISGKTITDQALLFAREKLKHIQ